MMTETRAGEASVGDAGGGRGAGAPESTSSIRARPSVESSGVLPAFDVASNSRATCCAAERPAHAASARETLATTCIVPIAWASDEAGRINPPKPQTPSPFPTL